MQGALIDDRIGGVRLLLIAIAAVVAVVGVLSATGCTASCKAQDIHGVAMTCNGGAQGYMWTGTSCIFTVACNCTGSDCQRLYATQDGCETAHIHCR